MGNGGVKDVQKLKASRLKEGYTFQEISGFLGYNSPNAYARKEKGERKCSLEEVEVIAKLFNKSVEVIFFNHEIPIKENEKNHTA